MTETSPQRTRAWPPASPGALAAAVVVAAAVVRLGAFIAGSGDPYVQFRQGDEAYYHSWAWTIAQGHWARGSSFFTTPLYAYVLALLYRTAGDGLALVRSLNVLLGIGTVVLTLLAARRWVGRGAAVGAAALLGLCAAPVSYELFAEKTSLVLFLTALTFHQVGRAIERGTPGRWLLAGISGGVASLAHTLLLVAGPAVWVHLALNARGARRAAAGSAAVFTLGFALGLAPATVHNWLQDRSFLLVCSTGGNTFYMGNGWGNLTGAYTVPPFAVSTAASEEQGFAAEAERRTGRRLKPSEVSAFWFREGLADIAANPSLAALRFWRRFRWTIGAAEVTDTRTFEFYAERHRLLRLLPWGFGLVSALGLAGLALGAGSRALAFPVAFTALFAAGTSAILVYGRYRLPLIVPLSLLGALALARAVEWTRRRRAGALACLGAGAAALAWFVHAPVPPLDEVSFFIDYSNQGNRYWDARDWERAFAEYEKALRVRPGDLPAVPRLYARLGAIYAARGELRRAEALLREGAQRYPADGTIGAQLREVSRRLGAGSAR